MIPTRPSLVPIDEGEHLLVAKQIKVQERKISLYQYFGNKISGHMDKWKLVGVRRWECYHRSQKYKSTDCDGTKLWNGKQS